MKSNLGKYKGRTPGAKGLVPSTVKDNILAVFNRLNGTAGMADWARENLTEFYRLYGRLAPTELAGSVTVIAEAKDAAQLIAEGVQLGLEKDQLFDERRTH